MISQVIDHVSFCVSDLDAALHFYREILGCQPIARPEMGIGGAWLQAGNVQIHLIVPPEGVTGLGTNPDRTIPLANHTAFAVDDYQKTRDHLKERGLEPVETSSSQGQMWVSDPAGNIIEFIAVTR